MERGMEAISRMDKNETGLIIDMKVRKRIGMIMNRQTYQTESETQVLQESYFLRASCGNLNGWLT
jgi:hypothetical protein